MDGMDGIDIYIPDSTNYKSTASGAKNRRIEFNLIKEQARVIILTLLSGLEKLIRPN